MEATARRTPLHCLGAHRNIPSSSVHQAPANNTPACRTNFSFAHNQTVIMDEIAPEYDVVVLGTGGTTPPELPRTPKANTPQVSLNACFQGNPPALEK
jgi:hypothetical protein